MQQIARSEQTIVVWESHIENMVGRCEYLGQLHKLKNNYMQYEYNERANL